MIILTLYVCVDSISVIKTIQNLFYKKYINFLTSDMEEFSFFCAI